jgi:hypothetical protein
MEATISEKRVLLLSVSCSFSSLPTPHNKINKQKHPPNKRHGLAYHAASLTPFNNSQGQEQTTQPFHKYSDPAHF